MLLASPIAVATEAPAPVGAGPGDPGAASGVSTSPPAVGVAMLVTAGVLAASFGVFAGLAAAENDRLTTTCGHGCIADQVATLNTYDIVADVSWISAAVVGVTGLVLLFALPPDTHTESPAVAVVPWIGPSGAGVTAGGTL